MAGAISLASLLPTQKAEAQGNVSGNVEYIQSEKPDNSYARLQGFYTLPKDVKGFTFLEFYKNGNGYFGKTTLDKAVGEGFGARAVAYHANEPLKKAGLGVTKVVPHLPKNTFAKIGLIPIWAGNKGRAIGDKALAQYFANVNLPAGFNLSSFGDWDLITKDKGIQWEYGEINLDKKLNDVFTIGYNPVLFNKGNAVPRLEHRVVGRVNFGGKK